MANRFAPGCRCCGCGLFVPFGDLWLDDFGTDVDYTVVQTSEDQIPTIKPGCYFKVGNDWRVQSGNVFQNPPAPFTSGLLWRHYEVAPTLTGLVVELSTVIADNSTQGWVGLSAHNAVGTLSYIRIGTASNGATCYYTYPGGSGTIAGGVANGDSLEISAVYAGSASNFDITFSRNGGSAVTKTNQDCSAIGFATDSFAFGFGAEENGLGGEAHFDDLSMQAYY